MRALLLLAAAAAVFAAEFRFDANAAGEYVATLRLEAPGCRWDRAGKEAALARVRVDGGREFHVMTFAGESAHEYPVFLGELAGGGHTLSIDTEPRWSAPGCAVRALGAEAKPAGDDPVAARAPVLFARENTVGKFSDAPLAVYAERQGDTLTYTVIFSNEDGGTSTRALMARWGRTTDIEYVYRLDLKSGAAIIQGKDHQDIPFNGQYDGRHPMLMPVTDNNMVSGEGRSPIRYQIAPARMDLSSHSREEAMNERPFLYRVAAQELEREGKLRPFGTVDGQKISDPRNYLYIEAEVANRDSAASAAVRLRGEDRWRVGNLGRVDYAIERDGWVQTTVELPPGTTPDAIAEIGFVCVAPVDPSARRPSFYLAGTCTVRRVGKAFFLDREYRPGASVFSTAGETRIATGEMATFRVR